MDIAALSTAMSMTEVKTDYGIAMLSKSLDNMEVMGEGMRKMLEASVTPHIGGNIDITA
ncbi:MAG: YjfB family protein [Lachnospiraceae bacterium]|nr:YjfB family protein [Lachnospiraceae bacterium]